MEKGAYCHKQMRVRFRRHWSFIASPKGKQPARCFLEERLFAV